ISRHSAQCEHGSSHRKIHWTHRSQRRRQDHFDAVHNGYIATPPRKHPIQRYTGWKKHARAPTCSQWDRLHAGRPSSGSLSYGRGKRADSRLVRWHCRPACAASRYLPDDPRGGGVLRAQGIATFRWAAKTSGAGTGTDVRHQTVVIGRTVRRGGTRAGEAARGSHCGPEAAGFGECVNRVGSLALSRVVGRDLFDRSRPSLYRTLSRRRAVLAASKRMNLASMQPYWLHY